MVKKATGVAHARIDSILIAQKAATDELQTVALCVQGNGLSQFGGIVLDGDVLEGDVLSFYFDCVGAEGSHALRLSCGLPADLWYLDVGMVVVGDNCLFSILSADFDVGKP